MNMNTILVRTTIILNPSVIKQIQKIKCVNSYIIITSIDVTEIPQGSSALAATNEGAGATDA